MTQDLYKQKKSLELSWEQEYNESGKYTLNMVEIDEKIKSIITQIKLEEARQQDRVNKIAESRPEVSVATSMEGDFETGNVKYKARERYSFGWSDWRGIFGSPGA